MNPEVKPALWRRIVREPLTHFLVIGAALFLVVTAIKDARRPVVRLDTGELEQLVSYWQLQMQRPPTQAEVKAIINERVDEELLAREALRLGMDKNDMIIRRRLAEKMAFASEDTTSLPQPSDADLKALFEKTKDQYVVPAQVAFRQVVFSGDRPNAEATARAALASASGRDPGPGDPFVLPLTYGGVGVDELVRRGDHALDELAQARSLNCIGDARGMVLAEENRQRIAAVCLAIHNVHAGGLLTDSGGGVPQGTSSHQAHPCRRSR